METANNYSNKKDIALSIVGVLSIFAFLISTNPKSLSALSLLIFPVLVAYTSFVFTRLILNMFTSLSYELTRITCSIVAAGSLLVVILGSVGQLGAQDLLLAFLLVSGLMFYLKRLQAAR